MDPIARILRESKTIAVVGLSSDPSKPSFDVAKYLQAQGFKIIPVNPALTDWLGIPAYPDVLSIPEPVDIVDIFRKPAAVPAIVEQAIAKKAKAVWMQPGAENLQAAERAAEAGLEVIVGVCMMQQHRQQAQNE